MSLQRYQDIVLNHALHAVSDAQITVLDSFGAPASLFDAESSVIENPVTTDSTGQFWFYVAPGNYTLEASGGTPPISPVGSIGIVINETGGAGGDLPSGDANQVIATPNGGAGPSGLRYLVAADIPAIAESGVTGLVDDLSDKASIAEVATAVADEATARTDADALKADITYVDTQDAQVLADAKTYAESLTGTGETVVQSVAGKTGIVTLVEDDVTNLTSNLAAKAPLESPVLTGTPTAPTASVADNSTQIATTAFVISEITADAPVLAPVQSVAGKTGTVSLVVSDVSGLSTALAAKAPLASPVLTGVPVAPTPATFDNSTQIATTALVTSKLASYAPLASPALTGAPTAPTQTAADNSTKVATTAYADAAVTAEAVLRTTADALLAPLASPALTGAPSAPTTTTGDNTTRIATTAFVKAQAYATLDSPALTGTPTAPTQTALNNSTRLATTAYTDTAVGVETTARTTADGLLVPKTTTVNSHALSGNVTVSASDLTTGTLPHAQLPTLLSGDIPNIAESQVTGLVTDLTAKAPLASPALSGVPTAPTAVAGTNTVQIATTAYADAAVAVETSARSTADGLLVAKTTTVNGHALSANVTVSASDLTTGTLPHAQLPTLLSGDIPANAANTSGTAANLSGTPTLPNGTTATTQTTADSTTKLATTAFVKAQGYLTTDAVASVAGKTGAVTLVEGDVANLTTDLAAKLPAANPIWTGSLTTTDSTAIFKFNSAAATCTNTIQNYNDDSILRLKAGNAWNNYIDVCGHYSASPGFWFKGNDYAHFDLGVIENGPSAAVTINSSSPVTFGEFSFNTGLALLRDMTNSGSSLILIMDQGITILNTTVSTRTKFVTTSPAAGEIQVLMTGSSLSLLGGSSRNGAVVKFFQIVIG